MEMKMKPTYATWAWTITMALAVAGCQGNNLPETGRYKGQSITRNGKTAVVAELSDYKDLHEARSTQLRVYQVLGGDPGASFSLKFNSGGEVEMTTPSTRAPIALHAAQGDCAQNKAKDISLCWKPNSIQLQIQESAGLGDSLILQLASWKEGTLNPGVNSNGTYSLKELTGRARFFNYLVRSEVEKVYQAKDRVAVATGKLLPSISIGALVGLADSTSLSAFNIAGNLLPFIFPDNWYNLRASEHMRDAEVTSMATLAANQINVVENLYYATLRDQQMLKLLETQIAVIDRVQAAIRAREEAGRLPPGTADYYATDGSRMLLDQQALAAHVRNEYAILADATGLPPMDGIKGLQDIVTPDLNQARDMETSEFVELAKSRSYEVRTLDHLHKAAKSTTKAVRWSFANPFSGSAFGYGTPATIRINESQEREISIRKEETISAIERQAVETATLHNAAVRAYRISQKAYLASERQLEALTNRFMTGSSNGDDVSLLQQISEVNRRMLEFLGQEYSSAMDYLMARARLERMLLEGNYSGLMPNQEHPVASAISCFESGNACEQIQMM